MVISGEKAVEQLEELLILMINSFEGVKDVIKFMSFEELDIVGFQTSTNLEHKINQKLKSNIEVSKLVDEDSVDQSETIKSKSDDNLSVSSEIEPATFRKMYEGTKEKRLKVMKEGNSKDKNELSAMVDKVKNKFDTSKVNNELFEEKGVDLQSDNNSQAFKARGSGSKLSKSSRPQDYNDQIYGKSLIATPNDEKHTDEIKKFVFPEPINIGLNTENAEEFISKHWIELMEV